MFQPRRVLISREGSDQFHAALRRAPALMMAQPSVGNVLHLVLDSGKTMTTTPVTRVANDGDDTVIDTRNSTYRLKLAS
jgi:hypothetical protein